MCMRAIASGILLSVILHIELNYVKSIGEIKCSTVISFMLNMYGISEEVLFLVKDNDSAF